MMIDYLPSIYHDVLEFVELMKAEQQAFDRAEESFNKALENQFVLTSDKTAIKRRESILGIQYDPETESFDFRKRRIVNRYQIKPPFTIQYLQERLDFLIGVGRAFVEVDPETFVFTVITSVEEANLFKELERTIKTTIPANLVYQQQTSVRDAIQLNERIVRKDISWNFNLDGSWKLGEKAFASYGPGVTIK